MKLLFLSVIILLSTFCSAQERKWTLIKKFDKPVTLFTTDITGNVYCATEDNSVYKLGPNGDSLGLYNVVRRGAITHIDATNPLRLLIYCAGQQQVILLDRMMTLKNNLDLKKIDLYVPTSCTFSIDGNLWIFDPFSSEIKKYDENLTIQNTSLRLNQSLGKGINISYMTEQERKLFVIDTLEGILCFDQFGNYITTYHLDAAAVQYIDHKLIYYKDKKIHLYDTQLINEKVIELPAGETIINARIQRDRLYIQRKNALEIYLLD